MNEIKNKIAVYGQFFAKIIAFELVVLWNKKGIIGGNWAYCWINSPLLRLGNLKLGKRQVLATLIARKINKPITRFAEALINYILENEFGR